MKARNTRQEQWREPNKSHRVVNLRGRFDARLILLLFETPKGLRNPRRNLTDRVVGVLVGTRKATRKRSRYGCPFAGWEKIIRLRDTGIFDKPCSGNAAR